MQSGGGAACFPDCIRATPLVAEGIAVTDAQLADDSRPLKELLPVPAA
jgi:3-phenylpropionate/trans-cinnamate dioxygenase ferredoxin reductase subunit